MVRCLGFFLILLGAIPAAAQRLPGSVTPEHYTLWFAPDVQNEAFRGRESIRVTVTEPTTSITVHWALPMTATEKLDKKSLRARGLSGEAFDREAQRGSSVVGSG